MAFHRRFLLLIYHPRQPKNLRMARHIFWHCLIIAVCTESTTSMVLLVFPQKHTQVSLGCLMASLIPLSPVSAQSLVPIPIPAFLTILRCLGTYGKLHCKCALKDLKTQSFHHVLLLKVHWKGITDPKAIAGHKIENTSVHWILSLSSWTQKHSSEKGWALSGTGPTMS